MLINEKHFDIGSIVGQCHADLWQDSCQDIHMLRNWQLDGNLIQISFEFCKVLNNLNKFKNWKLEMVEFIWGFKLLTLERDFDLVESWELAFKRSQEVFEDNVKNTQSVRVTLLFRFLKFVLSSYRLLSITFDLLLFSIWKIGGKLPLVVQLGQSANLSGYTTTSLATKLRIRCSV